jgi:hypothetical protein
MRPSGKLKKNNILRTYTGQNQIVEVRFISFFHNNFGGFKSENKYIKRCLHINSSNIQKFEYKLLNIYNFFLQFLSITKI